MRAGLVDVFTSTATAALEFGAMAYARGVIENQFEFFVRDDGMINHHGTELPSSARVLTVLALFHSYTRGDGQQVSTRILGRRMAPLPPFLVPCCVPRGFTPIS